MSKFLKIAGLIIAGLLILLVAALAVVPSMLPLESMVSEAIAEKTGRKTTVEDISLSLLGGLDLSVKNLVVAELPAYGSRPLLKLKRANVSISLLALLTKRLIVQEATVQGLELSVVRGKNGRLNLADMPRPAPGAKAAEKPLAPPPSSPSADREGGFAVLKAQVIGSSIFLANNETGASSILPLSELRMSARQAGGEVAVETVVKAPGIDLQVSPIDAAKRGGDANVKLELDFSELGKRLAVAVPDLVMGGQVRARLEAVGQKADKSTSGFLSVTDLVVNHPALAGGGLNLGDARVDFDLAEKGGRILDIKKLTMVSHAAGLAFKGQGRVGLTAADFAATKASFSQSTDLARLSKAFAAFFPAGSHLAGRLHKEAVITGNADGSLSIIGRNKAENLLWQPPGGKPFREPKATLDLDLKVADKGETLLINKLAVDSRPAKLVATGSVSGLSKDKPKVDMKLVGEQLDLDALAALGGQTPAGQGAPAAKPARKAAKTGPAQAGQPRAKPKATGQPAPAANAPSAQDMMVKKALAGLRATLDLKIKKLVLSGEEITDMSGKLEVKDQKAVVKDFRAKTLDGDITMAASLDAKPARPVSQVALKAERIRLTPQIFRRLKKKLPMFQVPISSLSGVFFMDLDMNAKGLSERAFRRSLGGKASLLARDGVTIGLDWLDQIEKMAGGWGKSITSQVPTKFAKLDAKLDILNGKADYLMKFLGASGKVDSQLQGVTELASGALSAQLVLAGHVLGERLRGFLAPDGTFPIALGGTVAKPLPKVKLAIKNLAPAKGLLEGLFGK